MQIVILGNGFDKASGLPTLYEEFFDWRIKQIKDDVNILFEKYEQMLLKKPEMIQMTGNVQYDNKILHEIQVDFESNKHSYHSILKELKGIMQDLSKKGISYLDLYFYTAKKCACKFENWYDVETEIKKIVSTLNEHKNGERYIERISIKHESHINKVELKDIYYLFCTLYFECLSDCTSRVGKYEIFKEELLIFEKVFKCYIFSIYGAIMRNQQYKEVYINNFKIIAGTERTHLINFNYTSISDVPLKSNIDLRETNVHGKYDGNIIFGIEQIACKTDDEYIFSKTYRKIENYSKSLTLPRNRPQQQDYKNIIFYGHSLSEADYSYFQSIFDLYDIYNQTTLIFKYSIYDESQRSTIAGRTFRAVTKLLRDYGSTMNNVNHGKNLIHKLLLEGRLVLEEVKLESLDFKFDDSYKNISTDIIF